MTRSVTLVTGASAGLGAEFARLRAAAGAEIVLVARRRDRLEALARELDGRAHVIVLDLAAPGAPARLLSEVERLGLEVDELINNAGFGLSGRFSELSLERQDEMIRLNIGALTSLTRLVLPGMIQRRKGGILNVASTAAFQPGPGMAVYFATKAYVLSLTEALHEELRGTGVRVSALCPGPTATEFGEVAGVRKEVARLFKADARAVAAAGLAGLDKGRAIVVPGLSNKFSAGGVRFVPRPIIRRIVAAMKF